jgi:ribose 1,5-bisphosphokinase PhnN
MATIQLTLPDGLAKKAADAGLLSAEAIQEMLQEKLLRRAGESLQEIRRRMPNEELTVAIEQDVVEAVQAYRAATRARELG